MMDIVKRLRGIYRTPITDGLGPAGGEEPQNQREHVRSFPVAPIQQEAADEIDRLRAEVEALKRTLAMSVPRHLYDEVCAEADAMRKVFDAAENLVKVRGRYHAEMAYERIASAIDAAMKKSVTSNPEQPQTDCPHCQPSP